MDFMVKLILSALPRETIQKLSTYARKSDKRSTIENFLNDMIELDNANTY